jgi:Carboxypeptidase regulatory-like domain
LIVVALVALGCASYCPGQSAQPASAAQPEPTQGQGLEKSTEQSSEQSSGQRSGQGGTASSVASVSDQTASGSVSGTVVDQSGAVVAGARVKLTGQDAAASQEMVSGADGKFYFANVAAGSFQLTVTSVGFAAQTSSGVLHAGENFVVNGPTLAVATAETDVEVGIPQVEVAEEQMKVEEKQRVLGIVPNFYVSYIPNAAPLNSKQKFKLAWRSVIDPFTIVFVGGVAGVEQAQNHFEAYGQGAQGYAKRFGAGYGDTLTGTFIGGAILPSILKQDPRYFYKGTGSTRSRVLYALAMSVICKGDNRRWQANYSGILGSLAAGGISNLYYPPQDRDGAALTFENAALGIAGSAVSNLFQEFVVKKLTPKVPGSGTAKP